MTRAMIHYESPADDPFKVPRPHIVDLTNAGRSRFGLPTTGGEIGTVKFLGLHPDLHNPTAKAGFLDTEEIDFAEGLTFRGWYAAFVQADSDKCFTYEAQVDRVELLDD